MASVNAVVLGSSRLAETVAFYRAIGVPLEEERHEDGPLHFACEADGVHFAIFSAPPGDAPGRGEGGATMVGFSVASLDAALAAAKALGAHVLVQPEDVPWGRRAVVTDPDGRAVELNQASAP